MHPPSRPTAPPAQWMAVGRNAYGEAVEEDPRGHRRVATPAGWQPEAQLAPWRACRATSAEEARLAMASMGDPWVSAGFGHDLRRAYVAYRLAPGQPQASRPAQWATANDPRWKAFSIGVVRHRGQRVLRAWLHRRALAPDVPRWELALPAPGGTAPRGVQFGLAHRLEQWAREYPELQFREMGLAEAADAATARLPAVRRTIACAHPAPPWAPEASVLAGWPPIPGASATYGRKAASAWPASAVPVLWATAPALAAHGDPGAWWAVLAAQPRGVAVFDTPATAAPLAHALAARRVKPARWRLGSHQVWVWGFCLPFDTAMELAEWATPVDPPVDPAPPAASDERVPYRALSRATPAEGVAGRALESNMHAALRDLAQARPGTDIDTWVAQGLGVDPAQLGQHLSAEQVDAVGLARQGLEQGLGFLLSDETGFGKGRALAALALTGLAQGRTVVFVTENPFLFSDFYRDLAAVAPGTLPTPTLLHQSARVVDPDGRRVAASLKAKQFQQMLKVREWAPGQDRLVFTTYAQLARQHDGAKVGWLKDLLGRDGWVLLDEAHNAAGASSVSERIDEIVRASAGTVFASATFAKHEANLGLYKSVLALPTAAHRLLKLALAGDDGRLREALTQQVARAGRLVRREHPPVPPPTPVWVEMTPARAAAVESFAAAWRAIFDAARAHGQLASVRDSVWLALGAALSRSVREFSLQLKADALVERIAAKATEDKKVVVVVDTTMEAGLRAALTPEHDTPELEEAEETWEDDGAGEGATAPPAQMVRQGTGAPPSWRSRLEAILADVCPPAAWRGVAHTAAEDAATASAQAAAAIQALPDWDLAPLDRVRRQLEALGIAVGELSGRTTRLVIDDQGWQVVSRDDPDRNAVVRAFNGGDLDVLLVTRAGCAGISLHAGRTFPDQRVRCLMEWDIAANPVNRVQFWGRVRRKDQVAEPEFEGLVLDTPEDRRIVEREDAKRRRLTAHMGTSATATVGWISPLGEALVAEWAAERPQAAFRIGVSRPLPELPTGRADRALVRSLVLPAPERAGLLARLARGVELGADYHALSRLDRFALPSRALQRAWWWGDPAASSADPAAALASLRLDLIERVWRPDPTPPVDAVSERVRQAVATGLGSAAALDAWQSAWLAEFRAGVPTTSHRQRVAQWAKARLGGLDPGASVVFTHPGLGRPVRAVVLGWSLPDADPAPSVASASPWALSQVALEAWPVGDAQPLCLPLSALAHDPHFAVPGTPASVAWFAAPPVPRRCLAMEGHPVQAAAWGRRWGWGRSVLVRDEDEGSQVVWLLPPTLSWEQALALPRDLVDVEHALAFWREFPDEPLAATLPTDQRLTATPVSGGLRVAIDQATLDRATASWLHHALLRRLRLLPVRDEPAQLASVVPWKYVPPLLHSFATAGVGWRCAARHLEWYQRTAPARTRARSG